MGRYFSSYDNKQIRWKLGINIPNNEYLSFTDLIEFLTNKLITLKIILQKQYRNTTCSKFNQRKSIICPNCSKHHFPCQGETFTKLDESSENKLARELKVCINCLRKGHFMYDCKSTSKCRICKKRHHKTLS